MNQQTSHESNESSTDSFNIVNDSIITNIDVPKSPSNSLPKSASIPNESIQNSYNYKDIVFLDWDDTLLPTSCILRLNERECKQGENPITFLNLIEISICCDKVIELLKLIIDTNKTVFIVTNGSLEWISNSLQIHFRKLLKSNLISKINFISAHDRYVTKYPNESNAIYWKYFTMRDILNEINKKNTVPIKNIISIGDSYLEQYAVRSLKHDKQYENTFIKTIKFVDRPMEFNHLYEQLNKVIEIFQNVMNQLYDTDLHFIIKHQIQAKLYDKCPILIHTNVQINVVDFTPRKTITSVNSDSITREKSSESDENIYYDLNDSDGDLNNSNEIDPPTDADIELKPCDCIDCTQVSSSNNSTDDIFDEIEQYINTL